MDRGKNGTATFSSLGIAKQNEKHLPTVASGRSCDLNRLFVGILFGVVCLLIGVGVGRNKVAGEVVDEPLEIVCQEFSDWAAWAQFIGRVNDLNEREGKYHYVPVYDMDIDYNVSVFALLKIDRGLSERERFVFVADWLGENFFDGNFIAPRDGYEADGVLVCDLNAKDPEAVKQSGVLLIDYWYNSFQGSAGGICTGGVLFYTLLQPGLDIGWPKSIRLVHCEGEEYDHLPLINHAVGVKEILDQMERCLKSQGRRRVYHQLEITN